MNGVFGGGQVGYNYEFSNNVVAGVEVDADAGNIHGGFSSCPNSGGVVLGCENSTSSGKAFGTLRGRLGYAFNDVLLYGTGGWAWGVASSTTTLTCVGPGCPAVSLIPALNGATSTAAATFGRDWVAGAGLEWGFAPNWTARLEYLHLEFDNAVENFAFGGVLASRVVANSGIDAVRLGANYRFNWPSPR